MRKASIRDLRAHTSELVREASEGEAIVIERRGKPVAELRPLSQPGKKPQFRDMSHIWNTYPQVPGDSTDAISEDRDR
ncbi:MAG TPA: type II toxin-antitoxin system prevent-host-death family antitoxin [Bryobacteraceae bacterium]|nr:type II toxin-antitoxin system prevent-host-death family antitoxin [Bryobacteraceae bacterium]